MPEATGQCGIVSNENIDNSVSQDKLYYNMAAHFPARNPSVQDSSIQLTITNCMWVEHEEEHREQCQTCLESKAGYGIKRLSHIEFLISSKRKFNMFTISECISFGFEWTNKLCKKVTNVPYKLCYHFGIAPLENSGPSEINQQPVSQGWLANPALGCYACLTSRLDIFIIDFIETRSIWKVGAPKEVDCTAECGILYMVDKGELDISSLRPIPSKSVVARYYITGRERSQVSAGIQDNSGDESRRGGKAQEKSNAGTYSNARTKRSRLYEGNDIDHVGHYADQGAQKNGLMQKGEMPPSDCNEPQGKDENRETRRQSRDKRGKILASL
ncbi:unnamed protein product [Albugo candida]|uniref:Uncharacterized protein n=1 Tax=Albugo candida TaxID=65357 RepID=A0A024FTA6_9STRA|nr:unnamed protein product [Albugo candida]|eukprot:CCI10328.1 unnamed protein product [Albugo candida]